MQVIYIINIYHFGVAFLLLGIPVEVRVSFVSVTFCSCALFVYGFAAAAAVRFRLFSLLFILTIVNCFDAVVIILRLSSVIRCAYFHSFSLLYSHTERDGKCDREMHAHCTSMQTMREK